MRTKIVLLMFVVLVSMFLCSAVKADSLSGLSVITVFDDTIENDTKSLTSLTFDGTVYVVADEDLVVGTTTRWDNGMQVDDPDPPALNIGANADNFLFESWIAGARNTDISSLDGLDYQETVFPFLVSTIFVLERGGNDNGTVQPILADSSLGAALTLTKNGAPYANTGVRVNDRNNNGQDAYGYVLTTDVPVLGLRITATGHDTLSISAPMPEGPLSVDAGDDMITWSGQPVQLDPNFAEGYTPNSFTWSAAPDDGVVFDPNEFVEAPIVTITKDADNPSPVKLTLAVTDGTDAYEDSMTIDLYDDACLAARAVGPVVIDETDIDENCITDFADFALMAATWLDDYTLTEAIPE